MVLSQHTVTNDGLVLAIRGSLMNVLRGTMFAVDAENNVLASMSSPREY